MAKELNFTDNAVAKSTLEDIILGGFTTGVRLERLKQGHTISNDIYKNRRDECLQLLIEYLIVHVIGSIIYIGVTPE